MSWVKITTVSFSNVASVNVDNCFSADYTHYMITHNAENLSSSQRTDVQMRSGGTTDTGSNYMYQYGFGFGASVSAARDTTAGQLRYGLGYFVPSPDQGTAYVRISYPYEAVETVHLAGVTNSVDTGLNLLYTFDCHKVASSQDGFTLSCPSGNISGTVTVYGLKES